MYTERIQYHIYSHSKTVNNYASYSVLLRTTQISIITHIYDLCNRQDAHKRQFTTMAQFTTTENIFKTSEVPGHSNKNKDVSFKKGLFPLNDLTSMNKPMGMDKKPTIKIF